MTVPSASDSPEVIPNFISDDDLLAFLGARHSNPFGILGLHPVTWQEKPGQVLRVFLPKAQSVNVITHFHRNDGKEKGVFSRLAQPLKALLPEQKKSFAMKRIHEDGFFELFFPQEHSFEYRLEWTDHNAVTLEQPDPYNFGLSLGSEDMHYFAEGKHYELYRAMGAHPGTIREISGTRFAVWAPNARRVSVVGDFNEWDGRVHPMRKRIESGIWEIFLPGVERGAHYKFEVIGAHGSLVLKSDPFALFSQNGVQTASIVEGLSRYVWKDEAWMQKRKEDNQYEKPLSIYEVHFGSWKHHHGRAQTYREAAKDLLDYVVDMGFTHIELLPITEFPYDGSWGYQVTGFFAPTSRYGSPDELRYFIDCCHQRGIGIILDWVPAHFPKDAHGLAYFDGTALYEHGNPNEGEHKDWGTLIFNLGRNEVSNFLVASALYWMEQFHMDGIRVDAVASMLYRDYSREEGQWTPNIYGGRENLEAVAFLRSLNEVVYARHPGVMMIAEESTSWGGVSHPVSGGGLGFGYKWNMGWMHDTLKYFERDPIIRKYHHGEATFSMVYAFTENFVLVISHDEVVHGKKSMLEKMPGDRWQKFANLRLFYAWMFAHPGKKLLFMGNEIAQIREWDYRAEINWEVLFGEEHRGIQALVRDLNHHYANNPALYARGHQGEGFNWLSVDGADSSTFAFVRGDGKGRRVYCAINATPVPRYEYRMGVDEPGYYREILNTDSNLYGGSGVGNLGGVDSQPQTWQNRAQSIAVSLPPLGAVWFEKA